MSASHNEIYRSTTQLRTKSKKLDEGKNFMSQSFQGNNLTEINDQINLGSITQRIPLIKSQIYHQETLDEQIIRHKERIQRANSKGKLSPRNDEARLLYSQRKDEARSPYKLKKQNSKSAGKANKLGS